MTETARQILSIVSHMMLVVSVTSMALTACELKNVPGLLKTFIFVFALACSALCFHALVADPRFGISIDHACGVVAGANAIALWASFLIMRRSSPVVN